MKNSGEELEQLVKFVEEILLPRGFDVTPRKRIFDDEGNQIAELDLLISGKLATTKINWLIECRDRPSHGSAPISWIEQLVGRRNRLQLDKVTAVSTTGFSSAAIDYAQKTGIELRTLEQISQKEIENWFLADSITVSLGLGDLKHSEVEIQPDNISEAEIKELTEIFNKFRSKDLLFFHTSTSKQVSMLDIWQSIMNHVPGLFDNIEPGQPPKQTVVTVNFVNPQDRYKVVLQNKDIHITCITFSVDVSKHISVIPISKITKYGKTSGSHTIAESVHFELPIKNEKVSLSIHKIIDQDGNIITFTVN